MNKLGFMYFAILGILFTFSMCGGSDSTVTTAPVASSSATIAPAISENPGFKNDDGSARPTASPYAKSATGATINVTSYGVDLADNSTDDRQAIENAINAASEGDEIYFPDGVYNLASTSAVGTSSDVYSNIRIRKNNLVLRGQSRSGTILKTTLDDDDTVTLSRMVLRMRAQNNITIKDMSITSTWNRAYSDATATNNAAGGGPSYCIGIEGDSASGVFGEKITIQNVLVEKFRNVGIRVSYGCRDVRVYQCHAQNATDLGPGGAGYGFVIQGYGHQTADTNPFLNSAKDTYWCVIDSCTTSTTHIRHAVIIQQWAHNNLVTGCSFADTRIDSIDLHGEDEYNNEIANNTITGTYGESAIGIGNSHTNPPAGGGHDKAGPYNWIHHNTITNSKYGITAEYGSNLQKIENNTITGGALSSSGYGIRLGKTNGTKVQNNSITTYSGMKAVWMFHNTLMNDEPAGDPTYCTVLSNTFTGAGTNSVQWDSAVSAANKATNTYQ